MTAGAYTPKCWSVNGKFSFPSIVPYPNRSMKALLQNVARSDALVVNVLLIVPVVFNHNLTNI